MDTSSCTLWDWPLTMYVRCKKYPVRHFTIPLLEWSSPLFIHSLLPWYLMMFIFLAAMPKFLIHSYTPTIYISKWMIPLHVYYMHGSSFGLFYSIVSKMKTILLQVSRNHDVRYQILDSIKWRRCSESLTTLTNKI